MGILLLLILLRLRSALVEFYSAHWAAVMILEPMGETGAVKCVLARQLAAIFAIFALLEADVAFRFLTFFLLRERGDIAF
mgnify:CR=1 FL=1